MSGDWLTDYIAFVQGGRVADLTAFVVEDVPPVSALGGEWHQTSWGPWPSKHGTAYCHRHESNEWRRYHAAYLAMEELRDRPVKVRVHSRVGMMRLMEALFGTKVRVRWSYPPVPRARYARAWA